MNKLKDKFQSMIDPGMPFAANIMLVALYVYITALFIYALFHQNTLHK